MIIVELECTAKPSVKSYVSNEKECNKSEKNSPIVFCHHHHPASLCCCCSGGMKLKTMTEYLVGKKKVINDI